MKKAESLFRRELVFGLRKEGCFVQPIESTGTGNGIPDLYVRTDVSSVWIECKQTGKEGLFTQNISFRPGQYSWLLRHYEHGGNSAVAIQGPKGFLFSNICFIEECKTKMGDTAYRVTQSDSDLVFIKNLDFYLIHQWLRRF
jgi:Holliday junction resolvase